jgi:AcrR family transcriptional regulator
MAGRFDAFHALEPEKRKRIIDAALAEFAQKGFKQASTNTIAANARIGKGMLFYYFSSKEELFDFLCEYTIEFARNEYLARFTFDTGDFLERYSKLTGIKRQAMADSPLVITFFESFYREANAEYFSKYLAIIGEIREKVINRIYENVDYTLFRGDIDGAAAVDYIKWLFEGYQNNIEARFKRGAVNMSDPDEVALEWKRYDNFTRDVRRILYKENE